MHSLIPIEVGLPFVAAAKTTIARLFALMTGYSDMRDLPDYDRPGERAARVFGSGGSRSFQLAARLTF